MTSKQGLPRRRASALGLALLVALAFGAIAASGAQALDWQHQSGTTVLPSSETVAGTGSGFTITSKLLGTSVEVNCSSATSGGSIVAGGTGSSTIGLGGCTVAKPSNCSLAYQPTLSANIELVQVGGVLFQKFVPAGTGGFGKIEFAGTKCSLSENKASLSGSFAGRELSSALAANHSLSFTKSEPWPSVELKFGVEAATMTGEVTQHLSGNMANHGWRGIWQETHGGWEVEGSAFTSTESVTVAGGPVNFSFSLLGTPVSFSCSKTSSGGASVKPGGTETVKGLTFSGCTVEKPAGCTLSGSQMQFGEITGTLMRVNGKVYEKFAPANPEGILAVLEFSGASCGLAGNAYTVKGTFAGLGTEFGLYKTFQPLEFSKAANEATGSQLTIAGNGITMAGTINQELFNGTPWGAY